MSFCRSFRSLSSVSRNSVGKSATSNVVDILNENKT
jgi:hypothetical protein